MQGTGLPALPPPSRLINRTVLTVQPAAARGSTFYALLGGRASETNPSARFTVAAPVLLGLRATLAAVDDGRPGPGAAYAVQSSSVGSGAR